MGKNGAGLPRTGKKWKNHRTLDVETEKRLLFSTHPKIERGSIFDLHPILWVVETHQRKIKQLQPEATMKTGDLETNLLPVHSAEATHCNTWDGSTPHPCSHGI